MRLLANAPAKGWLLAGTAALLLSGVVQHHVETRREEARLTLTVSEQKEALEVGFLALGGFRGILADMLWIRAQQQQDTARYYELKLLCDMILRLQPTFTQVHAYQAWNMSYNLAFKAETCQDKWYWIRAGLCTLEKGLQRNLHNYVLWFEMGTQFYDRLSDVKMTECKRLRQQELPNIDEMPNEEDRRKIFTEELDEGGQRRWVKGHARNDEQIRFAAYFFWKAVQTQTDPTPLRSERMYGQCIEHLRHWKSKKPLAERKAWDDWGSEDWWVEMIRRNNARGMTDEDTVPTNLRFCMYTQMDHWLVSAETAGKSGDETGAKACAAMAEDCYKRYSGYFPANKKSMKELMEIYREFRDRPRGTQ